MYTLEGAYKFSVLSDQFKGGNAIFNCPPFPIKCGGAPVKILYLSEENFRKKGIRENTNMMFYTATPVLFPPQADFNNALNETCESKGIEKHVKHNLIAIDKENRVATFKNLNSEEIVKQEFDLLHFVPP